MIAVVLRPPPTAFGPVRDPQHWRLLFAPAPAVRTRVRFRRSAPYRGRMRTPTPRIPSLLVALVGALVLVAGACGGDDSATEKTSPRRSTSTTTTKSGGSGSDTALAGGILGKAGGQQFDGSGFGADIEECVGRSVTTALGQKDAEAMASAELAEYTAEEMDALLAAFNKCVPGTELARSLTTSFYRTAGMKTAPGSAVLTCVGKALDGRTGEVVAEGARSDSGVMPQFTLQILDRCVPPGDISGMLEASFADAGLTPEQASCTAKALEGQISVSELAEAGFKEGSPALEAKVSAAAETCS